MNNNSNITSKNKDNKAKQCGMHIAHTAKDYLQTTIYYIGGHSPP